MEDRSREVSMALTEVRTVLSRADFPALVERLRTALNRLGAR